MRDDVRDSGSATFTTKKPPWPSWKRLDRPAHHSGGRKSTARRRSGAPSPRKQLVADVAWMSPSVSLSPRGLRHSALSISFLSPIFKGSDSRLNIHPVTHA